MSKQPKPVENEDGLAKHLQSPMQRRTFFRYASASAAAATILLTTSCDDDDDDVDPPLGAVNLGSGDIGVLNYAYALEQLEAAYYTMVVDMGSNALSPAEMDVMRDLQAHEVAHRELFKTALGNNAIPALDVDFSSVNFNDRNSILQTAKTFENLGVAAYNGAGKLLTDSGVGLDYLLLAGKIVSVEARHAAVIDDLIAGNGRYGEEFINDDGLDRALMPSEVLMAAAPFITTEIDFSNLPQ